MSYEELIAESKATVERFEVLCHACRAGRFDECEGTLGTVSDCPGAGPSATAYIRALRVLGNPDGAEKSKNVPRRTSQPIEVGAPPAQGDSGYIHPDAWTSSGNIGELADASSTGRKRAAKMFPIPAGYVCVWARNKHNGGGPRPIIGCLGNPATDLHHGPDKNTLNNEKGSAGVGVHDNVHLICSSCHNKWHADNDPFYPDYDRQADQARPWLPVTSDDWGLHEPVDASMEELVAEEERRLASEKRRGRTKRGRSGDLAPDLTIHNEGDGNGEAHES